MPESNGFLGRWSRRKLEAAGEVTPQPVAKADAAELPVPELPPIESLGERSDYTAFLNKGVSAVVQQQALRRAWESDAAIASFRGMADYNWDFNAPSYGRLWAVDDVAKLLSDVLASPPVEHLRAEPDGLHRVAVTGASPVVEAAADDLATETIVGRAVEPGAIESEGLDSAPLIRRHGGAMPC